MQRLGGALALLLLVAALAGCHDEPTAPRTTSDAVPLLDSSRRFAADEAVEYSPVQLDMAGALYGTALDINDAGVVVGGLVGGPFGNAGAPVRWLPDGRVERLTALTGVVGIANDGTVGGYIGCGVAVWHPTTGVTRLPTEPGAGFAQCPQVMRMSSSGVLVVSSSHSPNGPIGFLFSRGSSGEWQRQAITPPPGFNSILISDAHAELGAVGTLYERDGGPGVAFRWTPSGGISLLASRTIYETAARAISGTGLIVGLRNAGPPTWVTTPVRFENGEALSLAGDGTGPAWAVNDRGDALVSDGWTSRIVLASGTSVLLRGSLQYARARDLNGNGVAVGSEDGGGISRPLRWVVGPPPPEVTFAVDALGPYSGSEGQMISIGSARVITGGTPPFTYRWEFGDGETSAAIGSLHTYADDGTYLVRLTVTDAAGRTAVDSATATISNAAPSLLVRSVSPTSISSGGSVWVEARYDDAGKRDAPWTLELTAYGYPLTPDGPPSAIYRASASSSGTPPGPIGAAITLRRAGPYNLVVSVRDKDGASNTPPAWSVSVQRLVVPTTAAASGELLTITLASTTSVPLANAALASVRLGDGVVAGVPIATGADGRPIASVGDVTGDGIADLVLAFRWADLEASGALSVPARGLVLHGDMTDERQFEGRAPVPPRPPIVTVGGPYLATEGAPLAFDATATGGTAPLALRWSFGDGAEATTLAPTHAYVDDGTYTITFTATDAAGQVATGTTTATIANAPPVLTLEPGATIYSGDTFTARGHVTDAGVADAPWRWTVQWPEGLPTTSGELASVPGDFTATATIRRGGSALVSVRVVDADGGVASGVVPVVVRRLEVPMTVSPARVHPAERGKGLLTVTLRSTTRVAADDVVVESVRLNGVPVDARGDDAPFVALAGWRDGDSALVLKFRRDALAAVGPPGLLVLQADLRDGRQIEARFTLAPK